MCKNRTAIQTACLLITAILTLPLDLFVLSSIDSLAHVTFKQTCLVIVFIIQFFIIYFLILALHLESIKTEELEKKQND